MEYGCRGDHRSPTVLLKSDVEMLSCTKPPLRPLGTSPQGEAYKAPIEGSCQRSRLRGGEGKRRAEVEYGCRGDHWSPVVVLKSDVEVLSCTKPPLRPLGTSPQGEAYKAPIERSCRPSRLRGGKIKAYSFYFCTVLKR